MSILVPPEYLYAVNRYSGYINPKSVYSKKNLKGLFRGVENQRYLSNNLFKLITNEKHVSFNLAEPITDYRDYQDAGIRTGYNNTGAPGAISKKVQTLVNAFSKTKTFLDNSIEDLIEMTELPYPEDVVVINPIQQLHHVNRDFLLKTSKNIIQCPTMLVPRFFSINPETGEDESKIEYDYTSESYSDGVWKPEDLFLNSNRNRGNPYWEPVEVNYYANPDSKGPGHRYNSKQYSATKRTRSQFPRWQYSVEDKPIERRSGESLREGGNSDRRVQRNRGYNMSNLVSKSTY